MQTQARGVSEAHALERAFGIGSGWFRELMEEIRGEGGKSVLKSGPVSSSNTRRAVVTAAGLPGGARGPLEGGASGAAGRVDCAGASFLHGKLDCLDPGTVVIRMLIKHLPRLPTAAKFIVLESKRSPSLPRL